MVGYLRNVALLLHVQRSRRHKNCRIDGLVFDNIYLKFNSKQSSTWDLAKEILQVPILRKRILLADKSDNHVTYHITRQIWQLLQHGMGSLALGKDSGRASILVFPVQRRRQRSYALFYNVFFGHDFLSLHTTIASGVENRIPAQHVLLL